MNKKFLSVILFGALMASSTGMFVSCKDYDDDIKDLQGQIDNLKGLDTELDAVKTALTEATATLATTKTTAEEALKKATDAETAAKAAGDAAAEAKAAADKATAAAELAAANAKEAAIKAAEEKIEEFKKELANSGGASSQEVAALQVKIQNFIDEVSALIGHRLTSIALLPTVHVNGIPAIELKTLTYTPQQYVKMSGSHVGGPTDANHTSRPVLDHSAVSGERSRFITGGSSIAKFHLNPSVGIRPEDIDMPLFSCITSENTTRTVSDASAYENSPIMPVPGQELKIDKGVLELKIQRSPSVLNTDIRPEGEAHGTSKTEKFYMASLKVPVKQANWTDAEKKAYEAGEIKGVYVNSEYARIEDDVYVPYIVNSKTNFKQAMTGAFADEMQTVGSESFYVHYHDSLCLYNSKNEELVDVMHPYNQKLDLKTLVKVCGIEEDATDHTGHVDIEDYASYGLAFRFEMAAGKYLQGTRQTDEQAFGSINNSADGVMRSEVYNISQAEGEYSKTSIGREPIVRVRLIDTKNGNALVAQRYVKIRWIEAKADAQQIATVTLPNDTVNCHDMFQQLYSQAMNEDIYHQIKFDGGQSISKTKFHEIYKNIEIKDLKKDGVSILANVDVTTDASTYWNEGTPQVKDGTEAITTPVPGNHDADIVFGFLPDADDNTSYNLVWAMNPAAVGKIKDFKTSKYEITVEYQDPTGVNGSVQQTFVQNIIVPAQQFAYQGTYWKDGKGEGVFNVNPIVYNTEICAPSLQNPHDYTGCTLAHYSHIQADLVNGYVYQSSKEKPTSLAQFIKYIRNCAEVKFVFDDSRFGNYSHLAGYVTSPDKTELWKTTVGTSVDAVNTVITTDDDKNIKDYIQNDALAATINNNMGAAAATNANASYFPWNYNETLGTGTDECTSMIRLHEKDVKHGTPAANVLVGKSVPVNLVVAYNDYNVVPVQQFEVFFINPLTINGGLNGNFVDAEVDGSFLNVASGFGFTDWNGYAVAAQALAGTAEKNKYAHQLYDYYAVESVTFLTDNVTTSLAYNAETNTYIHKDGVTDGKLPTSRSLKQMLATDVNNPKTTSTEVASNPNFLAYFNNSGTPVNVDYNMFVDVQVGYKWGTLGQKALKVEVKKAEGTPSN